MTNLINIYNHWNDVVSAQKTKANILIVIITLSAVVEALSLSSLLPLLTTILTLDYNSSPNKVLVWLSSYNQEQKLIIISTIVLTLFSFRFIINLLKDFYSAYFSNNLRHMWSTKIFKNFIYSPISVSQKEKQGHMINSMVNEPIYASKGVSSLIDCFVSVGVITAMCFVLININLWFTIISFCIVFILILSIWKILSKYSNTVGKERVLFNQNISHTITETSLGIRQIKIFSVENYVWLQLENMVRKLMYLLTRYNFVNKLPKNLTEYLVIITVIVFLLVGFFLFDKNINTLLPEVTVFSMALMKLFTMGSLLMSKRMDVASYWPSVKLVTQLCIKSSTKNEDEYTHDFILKMKSVLEM